MPVFTESNKSVRLNIRVPILCWQFVEKEVQARIAAGDDWSISREVSACILAKKIRADQKRKEAERGQQR